MQNTACAPTEPSLIGGPVNAIATPALVVDLDRLEQNLRRLAEYFASRPAKLRPHFKSHKCVELARRQLATGSCTGITCAKLSEAEQLVAGKVNDILIANQVVGADKARRLAALNRSATVHSAVDSLVNARELSTAASEAGVCIPVLVEVDIGMKRCGVSAGAPALDLAREVSRLPGLRFDGLQGYEGHLVSLPDHEERARKTREAFAPLVATRRLIEEAGLRVAIVSGGGTGTFDITGNIEGVDEIQAGSYALMDQSYSQVRPEFVIARWVLATVLSAHDGCAVVDVGTKGMGCEFGMPGVQDFPEAKARYNAEEHTPFDGLVANVGDKVRLVPSHGCTTQNLHRRMWVTRGGKVIDVWPIEAAGCLE